VALNITTEELSAKAQALASDLGCEAEIYPYGSGQMVLKFKEAKTFSFVFSFVFDANDVAPSKIVLSASKDSLPIDTRLMDLDPTYYTDFSYVEHSLRVLFVMQNYVIQPKPKKVPANALTSTYREMSDFLFNRASMNEDMDCDGQGWMILNTYSSVDDDRSGINILLHFRINDTVDTGDPNNPSITLVGAEREANDHEWEEYSSKNISTRNIKTLDDLLAMLEKNAKPKGKKPKQ
jgi:hypothetical protein